MKWQKCDVILLQTINDSNLRRRSHILDSFDKKPEGTLDYDRYGTLLCNEEGTWENYFAYVVNKSEIINIGDPIIYTGISGKSDPIVKTYAGEEKNAVKIIATNNTKLASKAKIPVLSNSFLDKLCYKNFKSIMVKYDHIILEALENPADRELSPIRYTPTGKFKLNIDRFDNITIKSVKKKWKRKEVIKLLTDFEDFMIEKTDKIKTYDTLDWIEKHVP